MVEDVFVGLGGNVGDSESLLRGALREIAAMPGTSLVATSSFYRSKPIGKTDQRDFINAVARLKTEMPPRKLLVELHRIETRNGRVRDEKNGPRTIDLDLLLYGDSVLDEPGLTLPHPRMHERAFVLLPLCELAPKITIPGRGNAMNLLASLPNQGVIKLELA